MNQRGFSLLEALVGLVVASLVLAGAYFVWRAHQEQSLTLNRKTDARNELALASKRLQREVTLAGLGLGGAANLAKVHATGSDTLEVYLNAQEQRAGLTADLAAGALDVPVDDASHFVAGGWVAVAVNGHGEIRRITAVTGWVLQVDAPFNAAYTMASALAYPAVRERFWTDQDSANFIHDVGSGPQVAARGVKDFQVAFLDQNGAETASLADVRTVRFALKAQYKARPGELNSIALSSTAIPRNML